MAAREIPVGEWSDFEPVVNDVRMANLEGYIRSQYDVPDDTDFVSFVQPPKMAPREDGLEVPVPAMAIFAVISDNPKHPSFRVMTNGTTRLADWESAREEFQHYAGRPDPLIQIFRGLTVEHLRTIQNLRELD